MPLTTIPLAINMMTGVAIWMSPISMTAKIVITVLLVVKFAVYFYSALMSDSDIIRNIGLVVVGVMNAAGIVYTAVRSIWTALVPFAVLLVLLIVWRALPVIEFPKKGGNKE